jgi:surface antigen
MIQRISRGLAHEITQRASIIYVDSVSHGLNVDNKIEISEKKAKKQEFRSQKTIYRQDLQDLHRYN